jgi:hypothetical protein
VNELVPGDDGVPEIVPFFSDRPDGRLPPTTDQVNLPAAAPVTLRLVEYFDPTVAPGSEAVVIATGDATPTANARSAVEPRASVIRIVGLVTPTTAVEPVSRPVLASRARPGGREPPTIDQVNGATPPRTGIRWA